MREGHIMAGHARLVTAEEFAQIPNDDYHYELVEGRVIRISPPGSRHAVLATRIAVLLAQYAETHDLGAVMTPAGFKLATNPDTVREPDIAFVHRERIPQTGVPDGFWPGPPDLAVEITSPGDGRSEILAKVTDYLARGVRLVWVIDPKRQTVTVHRALSPPVIHGIDDLLEAGDVIPGFNCAVRRIFDSVRQA
jgi:Uma2 family endonuclease